MHTLLFSEIDLTIASFVFSKDQKYLKTNGITHINTVFGIKCLCVLCFDLNNPKCCYKQSKENQNKY